jgi:signal transduction histidine kinase/ligand-binding sensor domain-containing protein
MRRLALFVVTLLLARAVLGAGENKIAPRHSHDIWDVAAGFPGGYVYAMTQTSDGYLWIGTSKGLVRYDGLTFVSIREGDASSDVKFPITGVVTDSSDELWGTDDHSYLFRYEAGDLVRFDDKGRHMYRAGAVTRDRDGALLFADELQGLIEYKNGVPTVLVGPSIIPSWPTALAQTADGTIWIGTREEGVYRVRLTSGGPEIQQVAGLPNAKIDCLLPIGNSTVFIGSDKGLLSLRDGGAIQEARPELTNVEIFALANGRDGGVWIGTNSQLFKVAGKDIDAEGRIRSLNPVEMHSTVTSLFEDRDGNLWIGGPETIERHRGSGFATYASSAGLPCSNCGAIYVDPQQRAWFAPWDGGLFRLSHDRIEPIRVAGLEDDAVYSIAGGSDGEVWVARKYGGVTVFREKGDAMETSTYTRRDGLAQDAVYSIYRTEDGTVWAGTVNEGLSRFRDGEWRTFTTQDGLPSNTISVITGNGAGEIFVGTPSGLAGLKNDHWVAYRAHDGLPPGEIESLLVDEAGTVWIGTTRGLSFLKSGAVHIPVGAPNALYGEILGIEESDGWLWITTRDHVLRVRREALLKQSFEASDYREFGRTEGLPSVQGVKRSRSVVKDDGGRIWFSLNQGITVLEPSAFAGPEFPVTTRLDGMLVDGRLIAPGGEIRVPAGRHRLAFRYAGVNASNPEGVRYRYQLDNVDSAWSEPTVLREVDYTNIPPGRFRFHVMARNPDGVWSGQETTMSFEVEPAYWQTAWFRVASLAALLLLVLGLYQLRLQQVRGQFNIRLEERVGERTRIARELHDTLLQSFQGLLLRFQTVSNQLPVGGTKQNLDKAIEQAAQAITEGRDAVQGLRASTMETNDLAVAIRTLAEELAGEGTNPNSAAFDVQVEGTLRELHPILRDDVYRIAGEGMRNAFRHAEAKRIEVEIHYDEREFRLRVRDNGKGIDAKLLSSDGRKGHYGLRGMRERAQSMGGKLAVWSEVNSGTELELSIPATRAYAKSGASRGSWSAEKFSGKDAEEKS